MYLSPSTPDAVAVVATVTGSESIHVMVKGHDAKHAQGFFHDPEATLAPDEVPARESNSIDARTISRGSPFTPSATNT
jgi:hypothetical protein